MTVVVGLVGYAVLLCTAGVWALRRARWVARAPRLAAVAWLALVASALASVVLAGFGVTLSVGSVSGGVAEVLRSCALALRHEYAVPGGVAVGVAGAAAAVALMVRVACCVAVAVVRAARQRRAHRRVLDIVGRKDAQLDAVVVDHDVPAAYCLPGAEWQVVVTSGALRTLAADELAAVLAHERAHLRGRHHLVAAMAAGMGRAIPMVPAFKIARAEVERLLELLADDAAARSCARLAVADALLTVAAARVPAGALGVGGSSTAHRVRRLIGAEQPLRRLQRLAVAAIAATVFAFPLLVTAAPAFAIVRLDYCPVDIPHTHGLPHLHHHP